MRELQLVLAAAGATGEDERLTPHSDGPDRTRPQPAEGPEEVAPPQPSSTRSRTLLQQLQADIVADRALSEAGRPLLAPGDSSIALHASHGADRQVEVLREVLVGLLEDDPTLEPRDIVVMCPDIETYARWSPRPSGSTPTTRPPSTRGTGCGSGWPTGRCARSTRCCRC